MSAIPDFEYLPLNQGVRYTTHIQAILQKPDGVYVRHIVLIPENEDRPRTAGAIKKAVLRNYGGEDGCLLVKAWVVSTKITSEETVSEDSTKTACQLREEADKVGVP